MAQPFGVGFRTEAALVAQESENHRSKLSLLQTRQEDMDREIPTPPNCDNYYKEFIDASSGRRLQIPSSIVAQHAVISSNGKSNVVDTPIPATTFNESLIDDVSVHIGKDAAKSFAHDTTEHHVTVSENQNIATDPGADKNNTKILHQTGQNLAPMSSPPHKTNLYVNAPIAIEMCGKKRVLRPAAVNGICGLANGKNRVDARLDGPYGTELTVLEDKVFLITDHSLPNYTDDLFAESTDDEDYEIPINGRSKFQKAEQIIHDNLHIYKLLERTITDLRAKQTYDTRNPVLGWKIEYKPRINGVVRDGDWYVTSPSKKGYRSLRTLRDALLK